MIKSNAIEWANLRTAVILACKQRGDPKAHIEACGKDLREVDPKDWPWLIEYFQGEERRYGEAQNYKWNP